MAHPQVVFDRYQEGLRLHVPLHMHGGVHRYIAHGIRPGDFIYVVLTSGVKDAIRFADPLNGRSIDAWQTFISDFIPPECHGSKDKVQAWIDQKGLDGLK